MTVEAGPFEVVGFSVRTKNADEGDPKKGKIGPLWGKVMKEPKFHGQKLFAVYSEYESDHTGAYTLTVGTQAKPGGPTPVGMKRVSVPKARYELFEARGEMPKALIETWGKIWSAKIVRAYTTDFERHDPAVPGKVEVHVAVK